MKLEAIYAEWEEDSKIDRQRLDEESLKVALLHSKYHRIYTNEKLKLYEYEAELRTLVLEKTEFFVFGPTQATQEKGWQLPARGKVLKNEVSQFVDADKDVIKLTLRVGLQKEKCQLLQSIISSIMNRGYQLSTALNAIKFAAGV